MVFIHRYDANNIASRVEIGTAKSGEVIYLCRKNTQYKKLGPQDAYTVFYYALTESNEVVGKAELKLSGSSTRAELSYFIADDQQGKGIGTMMLHSIVGSAMITDEPLDNLTMIVMGGMEPETTLLKTIYLTINEDNYASQAIAIKNGFEKVDNTTYEIERSKIFEQYFESQREEPTVNMEESKDMEEEHVPIVEMLLNDNEINNSGDM